MRRKPLSLPQIVILALLWITICYIILTGSEHIDESFNTIHYHFGSFSLYSTIKISQGKRKIIFYPLFSLHFVQIDIFTCIFFIICCTFQFLSIILQPSKEKQEELINNYKKK